MFSYQRKLATLQSGRGGAGAGEGEVGALCCSFQHYLDCR